MTREVDKRAVLGSSVISVKQIAVMVSVELRAGRTGVRIWGGEEVVVVVV